MVFYKYHEVSQILTGKILLTGAFMALFPAALLVRKNVPATAMHYTRVQILSLISSFRVVAPRISLVLSWIFLNTFRI